MALNLKNFPRSVAFARLQTSLGELCVFQISGGGHSDLYEELGRNFGTGDALAFVRKLSRYICFPESALDEGKYKPKALALTEDDVSRLTEQELEELARLYIEDSEYLTKEQISRPGKEADGKTVVTREVGEIVHPREDQETSAHYLQRLFVLQEERRRQTYQKLLSSMTGLNQFSKPLSESITSFLSYGEKLKRDLAPTATIAVAPSPDSLINWQELHESAEEARLAPFRDLSERLDQLIGVNKQSINYLVEANLLQTGIAAELRQSGAETSKSSRWNLRLTGVVIVLTILGLAAPFLLAYLGSRETAAQQQRTDGYVKAITDSLSGINSRLDIQNTALREENDQLRAAAKDLEQRIVELERQQKKSPAQGEVNSSAKPGN